MLKKLIFIFVFVILNSISFHYLYKSYLEHKAEIIETQVTEFGHLYESAITTFKLNARVVFDNIIMQERVLKILRQLPEAQEKQIINLHNELYDLLQSRYQNLKETVYLRQLHFHHTDGRSFLRMHRPNKYGDPLFDVRYSIKMANTNKIYMEGFEEGRIFNGYRYVYPVIENGIHLGSVEISVSMNAIIHQLSQIFKEKSFYFMIDKDIIAQKVFKSEKSNYAVSKIDDNFVIDNEVLTMFDPKYSDYFKKLNTKSIKEKIKNHTISAESITINDRTIIATFLPIYNVEKNSISYLISFEENQHLYLSFYAFIYQLLFSLLIITVSLGIFYFIIERSQIISRKKNELDELVNKRTQELENAQQEKVQSYQATILAMVNLTEERDTYTAGHTRRVAKYSKLIAKEMNYSEDDITKLYEAAILHDVGKIITPDSVLLKPGMLNPHEYEIIKTHVTTGEHLLNSITLYKNLASIVRCHHERFDGSGYPYALKGDDIPPLARILAVADTFDAMTTNRIYKPRKNLKTALEELKSLSGIHYHPDVISAALIALKDITIDTTITQLPTSNIEEARLSHFFKDPLTGLFNLKYLHLLLEDETDNPHYECVNIISIKGFTTFNNQHGWESGDKVLKSLANHLMHTFSGALIFRIYGDDFVLLHKQHLEIRINDIQKVANELCKYPLILASHHYDVGDAIPRASLIKILEDMVG